MTAEIALLNKMAVTLAADSAVTITNGSSSKVYNSADKIFEGTNHDPIGVMVYNRPEISGIPVESIVKMYRDRTCTSHFAKVFDYAVAFLRHVEEIDTPPVTIDANIRALCAQKAFDVRNLINAITEMHFQEARSDDAGGSLDKLLAEIDASVRTELDNQIEVFANEPDSQWFDGISVDDAIEHHGECIEELVEEVFDGDYLPDERRDQITLLIAWSLLKEYPRSQVTGLVFAGFGKDEIFPSLIAFEVYGRIAGKLKYMQMTKFDVDRKLVPDAAIIPFAQKEMVDRFMYGLDADFLDLCRAYFDGSLQSLKANLAELLVDASDDVKQAVGPAVDTIMQEFSEKIIPDHLNRLRTEFSDMVRSMPKQELAALSESLVHITSLKRKFSADAESVGGPIDVAMITRAEGFVWVKRKHYFDPSLNPRYFARRYGRNELSTNNADNGA
ncbi:hypothetical protein [Sphingobium sp. B2]|uniref:hypothetical protein n=1 Tax=Sphingobium sp. B2 TaxID=2583228 RepID=UPI00119DFD5C|nr:hypothetical protein [Sphingobium sp. B2]